MSMFSAIAGIEVPVDLSTDWTFQMGELHFSVHEDRVELNDELISYDSLYRAVDYLNCLVERIESNRMLLSENVFNFVNANNELVSALGIDYPFSFATEAEEKAAGAAVVDGANDEKGFFAKAWDAIRAFFTKIIGAIKNVWNKNKLVDQTVAKMNEETSKVVAQQPEQTVLSNLKVATGNISSPERISKQINICQAIAQKCAKIPADPIAFIKATTGYKTPIDALDIVNDLAQLGIVRTSETQNGITTNKLETKQQEKEPLQSVLGKWNKSTIAQLVGPTGQAANFSKLKQQIRATTDNISKMADSVKNDPALAEKLARAMVTDGDYKERPYLQRHQSLFSKMVNGNLESKIPDHNRKIEQSNDNAKERAVGSKRMVVSMSMDFGKEVAMFCKDLLKIIELIEVDIYSTCTRFNTHLAKANAHDAKMNASTQSASEPTDNTDAQNPAPVGTPA